MIRTYYNMSKTDPQNPKVVPGSHFEMLKRYPKKPESTFRALMEFITRQNSRFFMRTVLVPERS